MAARLLRETFTGTLVVNTATHTMSFQETETGRIVPLSFGDVLTGPNWQTTMTPGQYRDKLVTRKGKEGHVINLHNGGLDPLFLVELPVPYHLLTLLVDAYTNGTEVTLELKTPILVEANSGILGRLDAHNEKVSDKFSWRGFKTVDDAKLYIQPGDVLTILGADGCEEATLTVDFGTLRGMGPGFNKLPENRAEWTTLYQAYRDGKRVILKRR